MHSNIISREAANKQPLRLLAPRHVTLLYETLNTCNTCTKDGSDGGDVSLLHATREASLLLCCKQAGRGRTTTSVLAINEAI